MFDPGLGRIYVPCTSGAISVFQMDDPAHFRKLPDFPVEPKIHSLVVDTPTHRVYAPAKQANGRPPAKMFVLVAVTGWGSSYRRVVVALRTTSTSIGRFRSF